MSNNAFDKIISSDKENSKDIYILNNEYTIDCNKKVYILTNDLDTEDYKEKYPEYNFHYLLAPEFIFGSCYLKWFYSYEELITLLENVEIGTLEGDDKIAHEMKFEHLKDMIELDFSSVYIKNLTKATGINYTPYIIFPEKFFEFSNINHVKLFNRLLLNSVERNHYTLNSTNGKVYVVDDMKKTIRELCKKGELNKCEQNIYSRADDIDLDDTFSSVLETSSGQDKVYSMFYTCLLNSFDIPNLREFIINDPSVKLKLEMNSYKTLENNSFLTFMTSCSDVLNYTNLIQIKMGIFKLVEDEEILSLQE